MYIYMYIYTDYIKFCLFEVWSSALCIAALSLCVSLKRSPETGTNLSRLKTFFVSA